MSSTVVAAPPCWHSAPSRSAARKTLKTLDSSLFCKTHPYVSQLAHDAYTCHKHPNSKPFPTKRPADFQHVGQVFFGDGTPRQGDIDDFMLRITAPPPCRRQPDWIHG